MNIPTNRPKISSEGASSPSPVKLFLSFALADEVLAKELEGHLAHLKRQMVIQSWHSRMVEAGMPWKDEVLKQLDAAELVILLISSSYIASEQNYAIEMEHALKRYTSHRIRIIPILIQSCDWKETSLVELQILPKNAVPVTLWKDRHSAWTEITKEIKDAIYAIRAGATSRSMADLSKSASVNTTTVPIANSGNEKSSSYLYIIIVAFVTIMLILGKLFWFSSVPNVAQEQNLKNALDFLACDGRKCRKELELKYDPETNEMMVQGKAIDVKTGKILYQVYISKPLLAEWRNFSNLSQENFNAIRKLELIYEEFRPDMAEIFNSGILNPLLADLSILKRKVPSRSIPNKFDMSTSLSNENGMAIQDFATQNSTIDSSDHTFNRCEYHCEKTRGSSIEPHSKTPGLSPLDQCICNCKKEFGLWHDDDGPCDPG